METFTEKPILDISTDYSERIVECKYVPKNSIFQDITMWDFLEYATYIKDLGKGSHACTSLYEFDGMKYVVRFVTDTGKQELMNEIDIYQALQESNSGYSFELLYADISIDHYSASYFVFAYGEGCTLQEYLELNPLISVEFAHHLAHHMEKALHGFHDLGILHRDIQPDNIFLQKDTWLPKVFDFSDAIFTDNQILNSPQAEFTGSPKYAHPSVRKLHVSFSPVIFRIEFDMYAMGVILRDDIAPRVRRIADKGEVLALAHYFFDSSQWS